MFYNVVEAKFDCPEQIRMLRKSRSLRGNNLHVQGGCCIGLTGQACHDKVHISPVRSTSRYNLAGEYCSELDWILVHTSKGSIRKPKFIQTCPGEEKILLFFSFFLLQKLASLKISLDPFMSVLTNIT